MEAQIEVVRSVDDLVSRLRAVTQGNSCVIAIDGFMGSGKTTVARDAAEALGGIRISLDSYVDTGSTAADYVGKLVLPYLRSDFSKLRTAFSSVVTEGICLLQVLETIAVVPNVRVYVKRISTQGLWHDGFHLEDYLTEKSISENEKGLHRSEFEYHAKWRPHELATIIYERLDKESS